MGRAPETFSSLSPVSPGMMAPPIANAGRDVVVQPGETVLLDSVESESLGEAEIVERSWSLEHGDQGVIIEVNGFVGNERGLFGSVQVNSGFWWQQTERVPVEMRVLLMWFCRMLMSRSRRTSPTCCQVSMSSN